MFITLGQLCGALVIAERGRKRGKAALTMLGVRKKTYPSPHTTPYCPCRTTPDTYPPSTASISRTGCCRSARHTVCPRRSSLGVSRLFPGRGGGCRTWFVGDTILFGRGLYGGVSEVGWGFENGSSSEQASKQSSWRKANGYEFSDEGLVLGEWDGIDAMSECVCLRRQSYFGT